MNVIRRIRARWQRWRVKRRRKKLLYAYAEVGRRRHDLGPGFTPLLFAYDRVLNEDLAVIVERGGEEELVWLWPENDLEGDRQ